MSTDNEDYSDNDYYDEDDMMDGDEDSVSEMDMDNEDFKVPIKEKKKAYEVDFTSLSQTAIEKMMDSELEHIAGIFGVDRDTAALLLRHLQWNKERLIEKYMDNASSVSIDAGISSPSTSTSSPTIPSAPGPSRRTTSRSSTKVLGPSPSTSKQRRTPPPAKKYTPSTTSFTCHICFDDSPSLKTRALGCEHTFCLGCWVDYLGSRIRDEQELVIPCMAESCALRAPDSFVRAILVPDAGSPEAKSMTPEEKAAGQKLWERFGELGVRDFVGANKALKYCPYPACTNTVSCPSASTKASLTRIVPIVTCGARGIPQTSQSPSSSSSSPALNPYAAGGGSSDNTTLDTAASKEHVYCFGCPVESDHRPVVCGVARMWLKKCADDSETANWIKSNTKECPICQSTIEKNGGCNHMTCKKCKHEFCWVCMGPWTEHGTQWYSCNRYEEKAGIDARDQQSQSRASLERYLHYYNRWANHEQSSKLSLDLYAKTEKKMESLQSSSALTWIEVQFMRKAVDQAVRCRRTLQWTYAMGYFLENDNMKELFEANQRDLERSVEELSELLEGPVPVDKEGIGVLRQKVTDKTVYVQMRNEVMLEDTANGLVEGRWKWNAPVEGFSYEEDGDVDVLP